MSKKMTRKTINHGILSDKTKTCQACQGTINIGSTYISLYKSRWLDIFAHAECVKSELDQLSNNMPKLKAEYQSKTIKKEELKKERKEKIKAAKVGRNFRETIFKEALIQQGLKISKVSFTYPRDWGVKSTGGLIKIGVPNIHQHKQIPFVFVLRENNNVYIINPTSAPDECWFNRTPPWDLKPENIADYYKEYTVINLGDPNSIQEIGEAIIKLSGDRIPDDYWRKNNNK